MAILGIPGRDLASSHCPSQYLIKLSLNLAQNLWSWSYSSLVGLTYGVGFEV